MSESVVSYPKVVLEWKKPLGDENKPFAYRYRLDFYWFSFRLHQWLCSDDMRAFHSHPINMLVFIVSAIYRDHTIDGTKLYGPGEFRVIKRDTKHFVDILRPGWTILFTWGIPKRWSFWDKITLKKMNRDRYFLENKNHICN